MTASIRTCQLFPAASVLALVANAGSHESESAASSAFEKPSASRAARTRSIALHSGMGVLITGLPPARYSNSLSAEVASVMSLIASGTIATVNCAR